MCFPRISLLYTPPSVRTKRTRKQSRAHCRKQREKMRRGVYFTEKAREEGSGRTQNTSKEDRVKGGQVRQQHCPNSAKEGENKRGERDDSD